jgi:hypothetical protein
MIGQYLSNTNESATVSISQNFSELNKALVYNDDNKHKEKIGSEKIREYYLQDSFDSLFF